MSPRLGAAPCGEVGLGGGRRKGRLVPSRQWEEPGMVVHANTGKAEAGGWRSEAILSYMRDLVLNKQGWADGLVGKALVSRT